MKDLKDKAIKIKGKDYVQVKDRILALAGTEESYSIETDYDYFPERKMWVVKAKLTYDGNVYTGLAQEIESSDTKKVNFTSALENAETSAVGRACAMAGIGVLDSIASADEMNKSINRASRSQGGHPWQKNVYAKSDTGLFKTWTKSGDEKDRKYVKELTESGETKWFNGPSALSDWKAAMKVDGAKLSNSFEDPQFKIDADVLPSQPDNPGF